MDSNNSLVPDDVFDFNIRRGGVVSSVLLCAVSWWSGAWLLRRLSVLLRHTHSVGVWAAYVCSALGFVGLLRGLRVAHTVAVTALPLLRLWALWLLSAALALHCELSLSAQTVAALLLCSALVSALQLLSSAAVARTLHLLTALLTSALLLAKAVALIAAFGLRSAVGAVLFVVLTAACAAVAALVAASPQLLWTPLGRTRMLGVDISNAALTVAVVALCGASWAISELAHDIPQRMLLRYM